MVEIEYKNVIMWLLFADTRPQSVPPCLSIKYVCWPWKCLLANLYYPRKLINTLKKDSETFREISSSKRKLAFETKAFWNFENILLSFLRFLTIKERISESGITQSGYCTFSYVIILYFPGSLNQEVFAFVHSVFKNYFIKHLQQK